MLVGMAAIFSAVGDKKHCYTTGAPRLNEWGLDGEWTIGKEHARLSAANGTVVYRFHARVCTLCGIRRETGSIPRDRGRDRAGNDHGADINAAGEGVINEQRLYQLIRKKGPSPNAHSKFVLLSRCGNLRVYIRLI
jgi:hypothetical protein